MSASISEELPFEDLIVQPADVRGLTDSERDRLIITATYVEGKWVIRSRYGDDVWQLINLPSNVSVTKRQIDFGVVPAAFRATMKAIFYRFMNRGRSGSNRPRGATVRDVFNTALPFLRHLQMLNIEHLNAATPIIAATYVKACKAYKVPSSNKPFTLETLRSRFSAVEAIYELSQYSDDQMSQHPWPGASARAMAGGIGSGYGGTTPLIPDEVFCKLFNQAYEYVGRGKQLLNLCADLDAIEAKNKGRSTTRIHWYKKRHLDALGWKGGVKAINRSRLDLRTACYIILASTSGCRNHELANLQSGAHHRTADDGGTIYHWMRSKSEKTDEGMHDWMIPEAAVRALRLMEQWAVPYQKMIADEISQRRRVNPEDPEIAEASQHLHSLFLGVYTSDNNRVRTLSNGSWGSHLKSFAQNCGLSWNLASHQFRRKFANYVAHSRFGDLRYLKEHYAHWSLDMTLSYAMDDGWGRHLDLDLYTEIHDELEDIKLDLVDKWIGDKHLAGGYGGAIKRWQREPQNLLIFKDHASMLRTIAESTAIRSNGHAWCTADNDSCVGNTLERTRCSGCNHSVIAKSHAPIYQSLYDDLKGLMLCKDIGEGGRQRVERDMNRCRDVLVQLGMPPEGLTA